MDPIYTNIKLEFFNFNKTKIGESLRMSDPFTYVTIDNEVLTFCVDNYSPNPIVIEYNITMNIYNKDHFRIADKDHLKKYELEINNLEELNNTIEQDNISVMRRSKERKIRVESFGGVVSKLAGISVVFIIILKILEILVFRKRLKDKKML